MLPYLFNVVSAPSAPSYAVASLHFRESTYQRQFVLEIFSDKSSEIALKVDQPANNLTWSVDNRTVVFSMDNSVFFYNSKYGVNAHREMSSAIIGIIAEDGNRYWIFCEEATYILQNNTLHNTHFVPTLIAAKPSCAALCRDGDGFVAILRNKAGTILPIRPISVHPADLLQLSKMWATSNATYFWSANENRLFRLFVDSTAFREIPISTKFETAEVHSVQQSLNRDIIHISSSGNHYVIGIGASNSLELLLRLPEKTRDLAASPSTSVVAFTHSTQLENNCFQLTLSIGDLATALHGSPMTVDSHCDMPTWVCDSLVYSVPQNHGWRIQSRKLKPTWRHAHPERRSLSINSRVNTDLCIPLSSDKLGTDTSVAVLLLPRPDQIWYLGPQPVLFHTGLWWIANGLADRYNVFVLHDSEVDDQKTEFRYKRRICSKASTILSQLRTKFSKVAIIAGSIGAVPAIDLLLSGQADEALLISPYVRPLLSTEDQSHGGVSNMSSHPLADCRRRPVTIVRGSQDKVASRSELDHLVRQTADFLSPVITELPNEGHVFFDFSSWTFCLNEFLSVLTPNTTNARPQ
jgi:hypothetical protein